MYCDFHVLSTFVRSANLARSFPLEKELPKKCYDRDVRFRREDAHYVSQIGVRNHSGFLSMILYLPTLLLCAGELCTQMENIK